MADAPTSSTSVGNTIADAPANTRRMVKTLSLVSALSGLLIVGAFQVTAPYIETNREARIDRAIFQVVPGGTTKRAFGFGDGGVNPDAANSAFGDRFYAVYDDGGTLRGLALEASGQGYQDVVRILYGYDPERQVVTGMSVIASKETPGIGDKIGKDPAFLENFVALDATVDPESNTIVHAVSVVKHGSKSQPWEIDGISGATVGSRAVAAMLDRGLREDLPRLRPYMDTIRKAAQ